MGLRGLDAAIASASITPVGVFPEESAAGMAARAMTAALDDAGLRRSDIDGLIWNLGRPSGEDYPATVDALGLRLRFVNQFWAHGRWTGSAVMMAAMAVATGAADVVACLGAHKPTHDPASPFAWPIFETAALSFRRYLDLYGVDRDRIADVVLAQRQFAQRNENAYRREPLSLDDYLASPQVIEPFRELDHFPATAQGWPRNEYGVCVLVVRADSGQFLRGDPVYVLAAQGVQASREEVYFGRPGLGLLGQTASAFTPTAWDLGIFDDARVSPGEIDAFYTYDAFSSLVWMALERFGHCEPGAAPGWATLDRIGPGGDFPINTNGGMLSEGHTSGWGHIVEMVRQLRRTAGDRQVKDAEVVQWASVFGDSLILTNDASRRALR
jgi:acetyl-CoA acetyltransferase